MGLSRGCKEEKTEELDNEEPGANKGAFEGEEKGSNYIVPHKHG